MFLKIQHSSIVDFFSANESQTDERKVFIIEIPRVALNVGEVTFV